MNSLDPQSREVLRAGQAGEGPTPADRERLREKLAVALAAGVTGPAIAAPVVAAKWWASRAVVGGLGVVSAVVVGVTAVVVTRSPAVTSPPLVTEPTRETREPAATALEPEEVVVEQPEPVEPSPESTTKAPMKRIKRTTKPVRVEPSLAPVVVTAPSKVAEPTADELEAETQGLREVQMALRAKDPARALALLDRQDERFARGQLRQEREGARVLALCATDAVAGAAAFERFRAAHPGSPLLARLEKACAR